MPVLHFIKDWEVLDFSAVNNNYDNYYYYYDNVQLRKIEVWSVNVKWKLCQGETIVSLEQFAIIKNNK